MNSKQKEQLATEIFEWLVKHEMWVDVCIYFNGKRWSAHNKETGEYYYNEHRYYEEEADPKDYFEYVNEPNILSMSFEGPLYHVLNAYVSGWVKLEDEFNKIFKKYNLYIELGNSWNLTAYKI